MFPHQLTDSRAFDVAQALLEGFNKHYRLFREASRAAKARFEAADWHGQQRAQRERIEFYDRRVDEAVERLQTRVRHRPPVDGLAGSRPSCTTSACSPTTTSPSSPRPSSTRSPPRSCTAATSATTSSSCGRRSPPSTSRTTSRRRCRPTAPTTPRRDTLRDTLLRIVTNFQLQERVRRPRARRRPGAGGAARPHRRVPAAHQLPDPGAVEPVLPQQGRLHRRQDRQRLQRDAVRAADPAHQRAGGW